MATRDEQIQAAGILLAETWQDATTIDALPEALFPGDLGEAAAIQAAMARHIGEPVVGWKVGGAPGPLVGRIYASRLYRDPAALPLRLFPASGLECEIGFRLTRDLPARAEAYGEGEVCGAVVLAFTMELTGSRFTHGKHTAGDDHELRAIVADNAAAAGLVVGPEVADWRGLALLDIPVELRINGGAPQPPNPRAKRTEPAAVLVWLANELSARGIGLQAGQYVTTGSATLPLPLEPGDEAVAAYGGFGRIRASLGGP
jgi:2-keto-4-pentenoate hydratase